MEKGTTDELLGPAILHGRTIGVLSSLLAGTYFGTLISSVARATHDMGGRTVALQTQNAAWVDPYRTGPGLTPHVGWDKIDGFVVIINSVAPQVLKELQAAGKPVVLISHEEPGARFPVVLPDNRSGVREAVEHLLWHGHRRVAFAGDTSQYDIQERYESYCGTLRDHGVEPDPALFFPTNNNQDQGGREVAQAMIAAGLPCTAVLAATDYNAVGIMGGLRAGGYAIPRDLAVVSFDDMPGAALTSPALSSISQSFDEVGATAVGLVARYLSGEVLEPRHYAVKTSFITRESCGCIGSLPLANEGGPAAGPSAEFVDGLLVAFGDQRRSASAPLHQPEPAMPLRVKSTEPPAEEPPEVAELGRQVAQAFETAVHRDLSALELLQLGQLCQHFYTLDPSPRAFGVLALARRLARALEAASGQLDAVVAARLDQCLQQVSIGLSKAGVLEQVRVNDVYHDSVWNEYDISMELLRSHEKDPRSLEWLARTIALQGALALWSDGPSGRELEIVGVYDKSGDRLTLCRMRYRPEDFPPTELLDRLAQEQSGSLALLLPVKTLASDWGFLALVVPPGATLTGQESYFQWSALLSQALDYDAVTGSLRQRNEDLAISYQRERDMAQREREMADAIRQSEERYALAARAANDGLWDWDLTTGSIYYSARWKQMLGYAEETVGNSPEEWFSRVHPEDRAALMGTLAGRRHGERGPFEIEHRIRSADGTYRWVLCRGLGVPEDGRLANRLVGSLTDITERRSLEEQLLHQALYDNLTGLPNRALFLDRLSQSIAHARRTPGYEYAVLWLDLDGFKVVNDSLGHLVGDELLVRVASRISTHLRDADTAARFGGDEFAVLLHQVTEFSVVEAIVRRLQDDLSKPYNLDGHEVVVTASIGIATGAHGYERAEDVLRDADIAMYKAKSAGRAGHATFDSSMYDGAISRLQTETALRQAIEQGQLELHYQPIVNLADGAMEAMEVLVRWRHPVRGLISPAEFLPVAEESGLIVPMGRWVEMEACRQLSLWKASGLIAPDLRASINLSNREFWAPGLLDQVDHVLGATGVPAEWLVFEITEGVIMHNLERALEVLGELHARGLQIHIDDFGTGYSSLEALHRLPIDALKIDRSFVANLQDDKSTELVRTIVQLGRNLGVDVIAEGIETPAQQHVLAELGCPLGQGYWFSVPVPAVRLGELLTMTTALPVTSHAPAQVPHANGGRPAYSGQLDLGYAPDDATAVLYEAAPLPPTG